MKILILGKLGLKLVFWKTFHLILMHFIPYIQCFERFFKNQFIFSKILFFLKFRLIQSVFRSIEISFKIRSWLIQLTFFKSFQIFLSLSDSTRLQSKFFCRFPPNFLQGFSLHKPVCPLYPFFFIYFQFYMHFFSIEGLFSNYV